LHYAFGRPHKTLQIEIEPMRVIMPKPIFHSEHNENHEHNEDND
jgi:hypothetical protein